MALLAPASVFSADLGLEADCRAGYWSGTRAVDAEQHLAVGTCFLNARQPLPSSIEAVFNARLGYGDDQNADASTGRIREAYLSTEHWRVGRQIVSWGRADRINPTDVFSPRNFTLMVPEDEEQKQGINALYGRWGLDDSTSLHVVLAQFEPHRLPQPTLPVVRRVQDQDNPEWALRLDHVGEGVDASLLYYQGFERTPHYQAQALATGVLGFEGHHRQTHTWGADVAAVAGAYTLRSEASVAQVEGQRKQRLVVGADKDIAENTNLNLQLLRQRTASSAFNQQPTAAMQIQTAALNAGFGNAQASAQANALGPVLQRLNQQFEDIDAALSYRLATRLKNDTIRLEWSGLWAFQEQAHLLRPRVYYTLNDRSRLIAGFDHFHGRDATFFGARRANNAFFVQWAGYF